MRIIDKNKDFYDHYSHIYGIDKLVTFDRRGSTLITNKILYDPIGFNINPKEDNSVFHLLEAGYTQYLIRLNAVKIKKTTPYKRSYIYNYYDLDFSNSVLSIDKEFNEQKHFSKVPISLYFVELRNWWFWDDENHKNNYYSSISIEELMRKILRYKRREIKLPILSNTIFTKVLDGEKIWKELSTYISSLNNDKDISIDMTEKQKAEIHGFDKFSFRHPIK